MRIPIIVSWTRPQALQAIVVRVGHLFDHCVIPTRLKKNEFQRFCETAGDAK